MTGRCEDPHRAVEHLTPALWEQANRQLVRKALAEFSHERLLSPEPGPDGMYVLTSDDGAVEYRFRAELLDLEHWHIDAETITRRRAGAEAPLDALDLILELRGTLGISSDVLPLYLEEVSSTLASSAFKLASVPDGAAQIAGADFQTVEARMTEGHPCFVAGNGRLGFDAADYLAYAPEAAQPVRLLWVAARRERTVFSASEGFDYEELLRRELDAATLASFADTMSGLGLDLDDFHLIPTHPWQWWNRLSVTFAADVARRRLVCLGYGEDEYRAQQSIRTFFNLSDPSRHYVKTALSVLNMGFVRGLSADYMEATPAINDWVAGILAGDELLARSGFGILRERAAVGYRSEHYGAGAPSGSPYAKMLAALWRESPVPSLAPGERAATMASLLHIDRDGRSVVGAMIARSGLEAETWLRRYLDVYLTPLLHCFYAYEIVLMPHGENVVLVLEDDVPQRAFVKDIAEEMAMMDADAALPAGVERVRADVPDELKLLSIFTDVFDCFLRFLNAIVVSEQILGGDSLWPTVASCVTDYQRSAPHLEEKFERYDLFADHFPLSCLNRLQLRDNRQMVDLQDPAASLQIAGTLPNPLARCAARGEEPARVP